MTSKEELLKVVDRLEKMALAEWAVEAVLQRQHVSPEVALNFLKNFLSNSYNKALVRKQYAGLRDQIEQHPQDGKVLEAMPQPLPLQAEEPQ
jgi:6-phosphogluconate dehydrogenase (decarboxylating)